MSAPPDEFAWIDLIRPLTRGDARALDLRDDVAVLPARPGYDLIITKDAMVEGVPVRPGESPEVIARRLLRTNLSDLAAKAAEPFGYFLMTAWPAHYDVERREAFARGLLMEGGRWDLAMLGGDTVSTPGPLTVSATMLGWAPQGRAILRSGGKAGDRIIVSGAIGDGWLGLRAAQGEAMPEAADLMNHYRLPEPLLILRDALRSAAHACADVSDGLIADCAHIAEASELGLEIALNHIPLSAGGARWLETQTDRGAALVGLSSGGDDYALVSAVAPEDAGRFIAEVRSLGVIAADIGALTEMRALSVTVDGVSITPERTGWRH